MEQFEEELTSIQTLQDSVGCHELFQPQPPHALPLSEFGSKISY